jgi:hypothetical protein
MMQATRTRMQGCLHRLQSHGRPYGTIAGGYVRFEQPTLSRGFRPQCRQGAQRIADAAPLALAGHDSGPDGGALRTEHYEVIDPRRLSPERREGLKAALLAAAALPREGET